MLSITMGLATLFIPCLQIGRTASPFQSDCSPCRTFGVQKPQEKKEAPAFSLKGLDGNQVSLSDFRGKPVLITFWATWCDSCKEEKPVLKKFSQGKRAVQTIVDKNGITLPAPLLLKEKGMDPYGVRGWVPQTYLIDQEGSWAGRL